MYHITLIHDEGNLISFRFIFEKSFIKKRKKKRCRESFRITLLFFVIFLKNDRNDDLFFRQVWASSISLQDGCIGIRQCEIIHIVDFFKSWWFYHRLLVRSWRRTPYIFMWSLMGNLELKIQSTSNANLYAYYVLCLHFMVLIFNLMENEKLILVKIITTKIFVEFIVEPEVTSIQFVWVSVKAFANSKHVLLLIGVMKDEMRVEFSTKCSNYYWLIFINYWRWYDSLRTKASNIDDHTMSRRVEIIPNLKNLKDIITNVIDKDLKSRRDLKIYGICVFTKNICGTKYDLNEIGNFTWWKDLELSICDLLILRLSKWKINNIEFVHVVTSWRMNVRKKRKSIWNAYVLRLVFLKFDTYFVTICIGRKEVSSHFIEKNNRISQIVNERCSRSYIHLIFFYNGDSLDQLNLENDLVQDHRTMSATIRWSLRTDTKRQRKLSRSKSFRYCWVWHRYRCLCLATTCGSWRECDTDTEWCPTADSRSSIWGRTTSSKSDFVFGFCDSIHSDFFFSSSVFGSDVHSDWVFFESFQPNLGDAFHVINVFNRARSRLQSEPAYLHREQ